jgi:hypothetical protein
MFQASELNAPLGSISSTRNAAGMVGPCGLEPQTSTVSRWRSSQLSYGPTDLFAF